MKKTWFMVLACVAMVGFMGLPLLQAVEAPADMTIKAPDGFSKVTKTPVKFSHKGHGKIDCKVCHHKGDSMKKCASAGCHDSLDAKDKSSAKSFYKAFHDMQSERSCLGCHKKEGKGPRKCTECHPKQAS